MQNSPAIPAVHRIASLERLLGVDQTTIYRLIKRGELDLVKVGVRASAVTHTSLARYADARGITLPKSF